MIRGASRSRCAGIALLVVPRLIAGAASHGARAAKPPASPPMPTEAEVMEMMNRKMGSRTCGNDRVITVSELQTCVIDEVRKVTQGGQDPTARREDLEYDFPVY